MMSKRIVWLVALCGCRGTSSPEAQPAPGSATGSAAPIAKPPPDLEGTWRIVHADHPLVAKGAGDGYRFSATRDWGDHAYFEGDLRFGLALRSDGDYDVMQHEIVVADPREADPARCEFNLFSRDAQKPLVAHLLAPDRLSIRVAVGHMPPPKPGGLCTHFEVTGTEDQVLERSR